MFHYKYCIFNYFCITKKSTQILENNDKYTEWAKIRYTVMNYILYTHVCPTLYLFFVKDNKILLFSVLATSFGQWTVLYKNFQHQYLIHFEKDVKNEVLIVCLSGKTSHTRPQD